MDNTLQVDASVPCYGVLVTGGSGFIGGHLIGELSRKKVPIITLVRRALTRNLFTGESSIVLDLNKCSSDD